MYTNNVGIVLINPATGLLWCGKRIHGGWSLPQGDQEYGESVFDTAKRELYEEAGLYATNYRELGKVTYMIPSGGGKVQYWVVCELAGPCNVNFTCGPYQEFVDFQWCSAATVLDRCVWFKREAYRVMLRDWL